MKILLIEDDSVLITLLTKSLSAQHHVVDAVKDGEMGWTYASTFDYNLIILDIMLPKLDGISLCRKLRLEGYTMPILLLTAQDHPTAKVQGLDAGADDYVVKPFDINELIARVRALLRRGSSNPLPLLSWGDLVLNPGTCDVNYNGQLLTLTTKEYDLLELFLRDSYHVFSSDEIIDRLWSSDDFPAEATVRSHLRRLRHKLQAAGAPADLISTIHGRGYYLKAPQPFPAVKSILPLTTSSPEPTNIITFRQFKQSNEAQQLLVQQQEQQYLKFLEETWVITKLECLANLTEMSEIIDRLVGGNCTYSDQQQAHQQAHKLVGTLGIFCLRSAMEISRQIERILKRVDVLPAEEATLLPSLIAELIQRVTVNTPQDNDSIQTEFLPSYQSALLLVDLDPTINEIITTISQQENCQVVTLSSLWTSNPVNETIDSYLTNIPVEAVFLPTVVLISLTGELKNTACLDLVQSIHQQFPRWSILVLSAEDSLNQRLAVAQNGGKFLASHYLTPKEIFYTAMSLGRSATDHIKAIIVDNDIIWLKTLPSLLQDWDIKVTTLADPTEFLMILQLLQPDIVIIDIQMPEINGLELCQILRSDPYWQYLPVILLSGINNEETQNQAFRFGADDYLCKPVKIEELAQRIRNRLARINTRKSDC
jgi:DNA-binding response OmpR family regulator